MKIKASELIVNNWWSRYLGRNEAIEVLIKLKSLGLTVTRERRSWDISDISKGDCDSFYISCSEYEDVAYTYPMSSWCDDYIRPDNMYVYSEIMGEEEEEEEEEKREYSNSEIGIMDKIFMGMTMPSLKKVADSYGIIYNSDNVNKVNLCTMIISQCLEDVFSRGEIADSVVATNFEKIKEDEKGVYNFYKLSYENINEVLLFKSGSEKEKCLDLCIKYNMCNFYIDGRSDMISLGDVEIIKKKITSIQYKDLINLGLRSSETQFVESGLWGIISDLEKLVDSYSRKTGTLVWLNRDNGEDFNTEDERIDFVKHISESDIPLTLEELKLLFKHGEY